MKIASRSTLILGLLVLSILPVSAQIDCVYKRLKPLRHVCGTVVDSMGNPIADATLKMVRSGANIQAVETREDGEFDFGKLDPGEYDVEVGARGFGSAEYPVVIVKPATSCKRALRIQLRIGNECGNIRVEPK